MTRAREARSFADGAARSGIACSSHGAMEADDQRRYCRRPATTFAAQLRRRNRDGSAAGAGCTVTVVRSRTPSSATTSVDAARGSKIVDEAYGAESRGARRARRSAPRVAPEPWRSTASGVRAPTASSAALSTPTPAAASAAASRSSPRLHPTQVEHHRHRRGRARGSSSSARGPRGVQVLARTFREELLDNRVVQVVLAAARPDNGHAPARARAAAVERRARDAQAQADDDPNEDLSAVSSARLWKSRPVCLRRRARLDGRARARAAARSSRRAGATGR